MRPKLPGEDTSGPKVDDFLPGEEVYFNAANISIWPGPMMVLEADRNDLFVKVKIEDKTYNYYPWRFNPPNKFLRKVKSIVKKQNA